MIMDSTTKQSWNLWVGNHAREMEAFIQTWNEKGCAQFILGKIHCDWKPTRRTSRGGLYRVDGIRQPGINIAMSSYIPRYGYPLRHYEYKSFDNDPFIGGFYTDDMEHPVLAVVAHEIAHAVQRWREWYVKLPRSKPHGDEFKLYYAKLRAIFVNPLLPDQKNMKIHHHEFKNTVVRGELLNV